VRSCSSAKKNSYVLDHSVYVFSPDSSIFRKRYCTCCDLVYVEYLPVHHFTFVT
jgi:hypothetical protein